MRRLRGLQLRTNSAIVVYVSVTSRCVRSWRLTIPLPRPRHNNTTRFRVAAVAQPHPAPASQRYLMLGCSLSSLCVLHGRPAQEDNGKDCRSKETMKWQMQTGKRNATPLRDDTRITTTRTKSGTRACSSRARRLRRSSPPPQAVRAPAHHTTPAEHALPSTRRKGSQNWTVRGDCIAARALSPISALQRLSSSTRDFSGSGISPSVTIRMSCRSRKYSRP